MKLSFRSWTRLPAISQIKEALNIEWERSHSEQISVISFTMIFCSGGSAFFLTFAEGIVV